jgi:hypothetical protein
MACNYVSSNDNRLYVGLEAEYGQVPAIQSGNRIPAVRLKVKQQLERPERKDKTGTRTFAGTPAGLRKRTTFDLATYMTGWTGPSDEPVYGPLFRAGLGAAPVFFAGGTAAANPNAKLLSFAAAHSLLPGQAVTFGGELRFVCSIVDGTTVELNAPFTVTPAAGSPIGATATYQPATKLPSVSIFDYWSPASVVHRVVNGAAVDRLTINVNGDYHEFQFSGIAADVIDSTSFTAQQGGLASFPEEPGIDPYNYAVIPGHLGEAWMGNTPDQFFTLTVAKVTLDNTIDPREREFGADSPRCLAPGMRTVTADLELFETDNDKTRMLYQAARQSSPITVMLQLGQQPGQLAGVYLKSVVPEVPEFDDSETRLQWKFSSCRAQGAGNDEMYVAFG